MKRRVIYISLIILILFGSTVYGIMANQKNNELDLRIIKDKKVVKKINTDGLFNNEEKVKFIVEETGLSLDVANYLIEQCDKKNLDLFIVLGLMKVESNFDPNIRGSKGERGLGQLMENTARPLAKNLELKYSPEMLYEPKYNILLFTTQLAYLNKVYKNDVHKVLTAYNRGQFGLEKYIASRSGTRNPAKSVYSNKVLGYASNYYNKYNKSFKSQ